MEVKKLKSKDRSS